MTSEPPRHRRPVKRGRERNASFSRKVERCIDEAEGNIRTVKHELRNSINPLRLQVGFLKSELLSGRRIAVDELDELRELVEKMAARLEATATRA